MTIHWDVGFTISLEFKLTLFFGLPLVPIAIGRGKTKKEPMIVNLIPVNPSVLSSYAIYSYCYNVWSCLSPLPIPIGA